jgi:hypothetical protein
MGEAFKAAKTAARAAGCDESPLWRQRDQLHAAAPQWEYTIAERDGRRMVERTSVTTCDGPSDGVPENPARQHVDDASASENPARDERANRFRLRRGLADQVVEDYKRAWQAWTKHRSKGRGMPRAQGTGIRDKVRLVNRYSNGQTLEHLERGTPLLSIVTDRMDERAQGARRGGRFVDVRMACGESYVTARVHLHRPIPDVPGAIRSVSLVGTRFANTWRWHLLVTCRLPAETLVGAERPARAVAVDLRWRTDKDDPQYLTVAAWADTDGGYGRVLLDRDLTCRRQAKAGLPSSWRDLVRSQQAMDWCLEGVKSLVWAAMGNDGEYDERFRLMRDRGLARMFRDEGTSPEVREILATWQRWYTTALRRHARLHERLIARREQLYYETAHSLCRNAEVIVLEADGEGRAMSIKALAEAEDSPASDQRQMVAPGRFRQIVTQVADRYGRRVAMIDCKRTSWPCTVCGEEVEPDAREFAKCSSGHRFSRLDAACKELLTRWSEQPDGDGNTGGARAKKTKQKQGGGSEGRDVNGTEGHGTVAALAKAREND